MKKSVLAVSAAISVIGLNALAQPAAAQLGQLRGLVPGASTSNAASVDPDAFLAETIETTKFMMVAAKVLAKAAGVDGDRDGLRAEIAAIQGISDIGELNSHREAFAADTEAAALNYRDAATTQAKLDAATAEQRQLLLSAAYNFSLGMARNTRLAAQAPQLLQGMAGNPMMMRQAGSIRTAGGLLVQQGQTARSMAGPLRTLMSRGNVQVPTDSQASEARSIAII